MFSRTDLTSSLSSQSSREKTADTTFSIFARGTGEHEDEHNIVSEFYEACGTRKCIIDGPSATGRTLVGSEALGVADLVDIGVQSFIKEQVRRAQAGEPPITCINMLGFSRGAVISLRVAHEINKLLPPDKWPTINIFGLDPVAGSGDKADEDARIIPPNVNYLGFLMKNDPRMVFEPQSIGRMRQQIHDPSSKAPLPILFPIDGYHGSGTKLRNEQGDHTAKIVNLTAYYFLKHHGMRFDTAPKIRVKDAAAKKAAKSGEKRLVGEQTISLDALLPDFAINPLAALNDQYSQIFFSKEIYIDLAKKHVGGSEGRDFLDKLDCYTHFSDYFINEQHRFFFKQSYPCLYDYLFQNGIEKAKFPADGLEVELKSLMQNTAQMATIHWFQECFIPKAQLSEFELIDNITMANILMLIPPVPQAYYCVIPVQGLDDPSQFTDHQNALSKFLAVLAEKRLVCAQDYGDEDAKTLYNRVFEATTASPISFSMIDAIVNSYLDPYPEPALKNMIDGILVALRIFESESLRAKLQVGPQLPEKPQRGESVRMSVQASTPVLIALQTKLALGILNTLPVMPVINRLCLVVYLVVNTSQQKIIEVELSNLLKATNNPNTTQKDALEVYFSFIKKLNAAQVVIELPLPSLKEWLVISGEEKNRKDYTCAVDQCLETYQKAKTDKKMQRLFELELSIETWLYSKKDNRISNRRPSMEYLALCINAALYQVELLDPDTRILFYLQKLNGSKALQGKIANSLGGIETENKAQLCQLLKGAVAESVVNSNLKMPMFSTLFSSVSNTPALDALKRYVEKIESPSVKVQPRKVISLGKESDLSDGKDDAPSLGWKP